MQKDVPFYKKYVKSYESIDLLRTIWTQEITRIITHNINLDKTVFIATTVVISFFVDLTRVSVYLFKVNGLDISNYFIVGLFAVASAILGSLIGNKFLKKVRLGFIRNLVAMMILIIANSLMIGLL